MSVQLWLIFALFGNGHGLGSPYFDDVFYWLNGRLYTWCGGFGAQLISYEWRKPPEGTLRVLHGEKFAVTYANRRGPLVRVCWGKIGGDFKEYAAIRAFRQSLQDRLDLPTRRAA